MIMPEKTCKMSKVYARSHEITNKPCTSSYYKETILNAEKRESDVKKVKNRRKQNFEGGANNMQLDKAGSEIALSWSPMRLKILRWRPEFNNWSPAGD